MYETLIMVKPNATFSLDDMNGIVQKVVASGRATVERQQDSLLIQSADSFLQIDFNAEDYVAEESREIEEEFGIPCGQCASRFEVGGNDPDMALFNDFLLICEKLEITDKVFVFDQMEGKLFGT